MTTHFLDLSTVELPNPDQTGRDLAFYRIYSYRFTDDNRHFALAEALEERYLRGEKPTDETMTYVRTCISSIKNDGCIPSIDPRIVDLEGIDLDRELEWREPYLNRYATTPTPRSVIAIVGPPRSGTTHLYNLLALSGRFAYFTNASCWAWPTYNLTKPERRLFTGLNGSELQEVLSVDNRLTREFPALAMPWEAEDIYNRSSRVYYHPRWRVYEFVDAGPEDAKMLSGAVAAHLQFFGARDLLTKSPYNSMRIPFLERIWGDRVRYLHISRDRTETADSIRRYGLKYCRDGNQMAAEDAWSLWMDVACRELPPDRTFHLSHAELLADSDAAIGKVMEWLDL